MKYSLLFYVLMTIGMCSLWSCFEQKPQNDLGIKHVVVIGFDGLSPDGLQNASTPNFDKLIAEGSYTFHARSVMPTSSSPNWASMIMGAGPEQHGITSNAWERDNFILPTISQKEDFLFPTIFHLIDNQIPNAEIGAIYHWGGFGRLFEKSAVDYDVSPDTEEETAALASAYIQDKKPHFTFIHLDHIDHAGHEFGHGTKEYFDAVETGDTLLGQLMQAIEKAGIAQETLVILSSDHGGMGKGHGGESLQEMEIPFILWGKSIKKGQRVKYPVYQYDNAATVAFALGLDMPLAWIGKPVKTAFEGFEIIDAYPIVERVEKPVLFPKAEGYKKAGGLFTDSATIRFENPNPNGEIRFTVDGSMPNANSELAENVVGLDKNAVIRSAVFIDGQVASNISDAYIRVKKNAKKAPVQYEVFYLNNLQNIPVLEGKTANAKGNSFEITSDEVKEEIKNNTVVRFRTNLVIETEGKYHFYTRSDDGSKLSINNTLVVDNDGDHGVLEKEGSIRLLPGTYPLEVVWFNGGGEGWLDVFYKTEGMPKQILPTTRLQ
ncbi:alkaline phosphatase family protein [Arenibacter sp. GZD96]|uniref:alkaline phosphatase family protein n=1 Tax=Aurantibrevibacter litoralis TaxID=3106030 RepID=UPI002AFF83EF|nr:alkaline phosphatase family protein [Arenibacter sp. GZD-96]MEA1786537.1 alkaline phosphatase family protein [Arenibacter sp. GZD-96]